MPIVPQIGSKALTCPKLNLVKPFVFENYQMCLSRILFKFRPSTPWPINHLHLTHQFTLTTEQLGISSIANCTAEDLVLYKLTKIIKSEKTWIPRTASIDLQKFGPILDGIITIGTNILLKSNYTT